MKLVLIGILLASFFTVWVACVSSEPTVQPEMPMVPTTDAIGPDNSDPPATARVPTPADSNESDSVLTAPEIAAKVRIPRSMISRREQYDITTPFASMIKPHFFARSPAGELVSANGEPDLVPDLIMEREGAIKVRIKQGGQEAYLDILALEPELIGEHPVHKVYRLEAMGVAVDDALADRLKSDDFPDDLFRSISFEYLRGQNTSGVVSEVFLDGTFLVIPFGIPTEWQSGDARPEANVLDILPGTRVRFTPSGTETFRVTLESDQEFRTDIGPELALDGGGGAPPDDGFTQVGLITAFPFMGTDYDSIFVGSDGHITLGSGDGSSSPRDLNRHRSGAPRLSALLTDFDPGCTGTVHANAGQDGVVVTWDRVVHIGRGTADGCAGDVPTNTVQATLYPDGRIEYLYGELDLEFFGQSGSNREAVIGIAKGDASENLQSIDITRDLPAEGGSGAIFEEFRPESPEPSAGPIAAPTHFHVNSRALISGNSALAMDFEHEILTLPFDQQRYPDASLARKQCDVYRESVRHAAYRRLLATVGYNLPPTPPGDGGENDLRHFGERLLSLLREGSGEQIRYFGYDAYWMGEVLLKSGVPWMAECDTAGGVRRYRVIDDAEDRYYLTVRRTLEPDKRQRYRVVQLDRSGGGHEIYTAPGILLMALPLPRDNNYWLISSEGWSPPGEGKPADPRWQSVYMVNADDPEEYQVVVYPISRYPEAPEEGLYGAAANLSADSNTLFNALYGFTNEGGGLWAVDLTDREFFSNPDRFVRIVEWDHMLSWITLEETLEGSPSRSIFVTGKEVDSDFAMTANLLHLKNTGFETTLERKERLLQMVGWNPVPFAWQTLGEGRFEVLVETHFDYESSLLPRAKGVYIISVKA